MRGIIVQEDRSIKSFKCLNQPVAAGADSEAYMKYYRPVGSIKRAKGDPFSTAFEVFDGCVIIAVNGAGNRITDLLVALLESIYGRGSRA